MVDAFGNPTSFSWSAAKFTVLQGTIDCCQPLQAMLIASKAFDANEQGLASPAVSGTGAVISLRFNHTTNQDYDHDLYQTRHLSKNILPSSSSSESPQPIITRQLKKSLLQLTSPQLLSNSIDATL